MQVVDIRAFSVMFVLRVPSQIPGPEYTGVF